MKLLPWLRLMRLPNLPSAPSNVLAGAAFGIGLGASANWTEIILAALASLFIYAAGLIFNDVADYEFDAETRPERPLPSGEISRNTAIVGGSILMLLGIGCAAYTGENASRLFFAIAIAVLLYDFLLKESPAFGPLCLGFCRAANWLIGFLVVSSNLRIAFGSIFQQMPLGLAAGYFLYVCSLSSFARMEDSKVETLRGRVELGLAIGALALFAQQIGQWLPALFLIPVFWFGVQAFFNTQEWDLPFARKTVGNLLMGIYWIDAAIAFLGFGWWALAFLAPFLLASRLRKLISPT